MADRSDQELLPFQAGTIANSLSYQVEKLLPALLLEVLVQRVLPVGGVEVIPLRGAEPCRADHTPSECHQ